MTTYYVSNSGDDTNNGYSDGAWATLDKISTSTFSPGDSILLERGSTWEVLKSANSEVLVDTYSLRVPSSGAEGAPITFGAYGSGAKPIIYGSKNFNETGDWTEIDTNKWSTTSGLMPRQDGWMGTFVVFGSEAPDNVGYFIGPDDVASLDTVKNYTYVTADDTIVVYSVGNPATVYGNMHISSQGKPFYSDYKNYITVENIEVRRSQGCLILFDGGHDIIIQDCECHYFGGAYSPFGYRHGDGLALYSTMSNVIVRRCNVSQGFDAGISWQSFRSEYAEVASNITFEDNIVDGCGLGMAIVTYNKYDYSTGSFSDGYIRRNTISNSGYGWSGYVQNSVKGKGLAVSGAYKWNKMENTRLRY